MKTQKLVLVSLFIALSFLAGYIKFFGSIALDSFPAFLGTLLLGPTYGMIIALLGHLFSAFLSGFPLTLPVHLIVGVMMMLTMFVYGSFRQKYSDNMISVVTSDLIALVFNTVISSLPLIPILGFNLILAMMIPLVAASIVNILVAETMYRVLPTYFVAKMGLNK